MKYFKYLLLVLVATVGFISCNSEDNEYDIYRTAIHPLGGEYIVTVSSGGATVATVSCIIGNTIKNDKDSCWVRIGSYSSASIYAINGKIACDVSSLSFSGTATNLAGNVATSTQKFTLTGGKVVLKGAVAPSKTVADKISFTYTTTKNPGVTYSVEGYRRTGWEEDEP